MLRPNIRRACRGTLVVHQTRRNNGFGCDSLATPGSDRQIRTAPDVVFYEVLLATPLTRSRWAVAGGVALYLAIALITIVLGLGVGIGAGACVRWSGEFINRLSVC